ncbi:hypothetical protein [Shewanella frigidimarina]
MPNNGMVNTYQIGGYYPAIAVVSTTRTLLIRQYGLLAKQWQA